MQYNYMDLYKDLPNGQVAALWIISDDPEIDDDGRVRDYRHLLDAYNAVVVAGVFDNREDAQEFLERGCESKSYNLITGKGLIKGLMAIRDMLYEAIEILYSDGLDHPMNIEVTASDRKRFDVYRKYLTKYCGFAWAWDRIDAIEFLYKQI